MSLSDKVKLPPDLKVKLGRKLVLYVLTNKYFAQQLSQVVEWSYPYVAEVVEWSNPYVAVEKSRVQLALEQKL